MMKHAEGDVISRPCFFHVFSLDAFRRCWNTYLTKIFQVSEGKSRSDTVIIIIIIIMAENNALVKISIVKVLSLAMHEY